MNPTTRRSIQTAMATMMAFTSPAFAKTSQQKIQPPKSGLQLESLEKKVHPYNQQTIPQAIRFLSLAMQAWNPSLRTVNVGAIINSNVQTYGVAAGLIGPALTLIDISFAAGRPEFGNLLNPMLTQLAPEVGAMMNQKFGMAADYEGRDFNTISKYGNADIWSTMTQTLGGDFYSQHPEGKQANQLDQKRDLATQIFQGEGSYFAYRMNKEYGQYNMRPGANNNPQNGPQRQIPGRDTGVSSTPRPPGSIDDSMSNGRTPIGNRNSDIYSTPGNSRDVDNQQGRMPFTTDNGDIMSTPGRRSGQVDDNARGERPKGPLSNRDMESYKSCFNECYNNAADNIPKGAKAGGVIGGTIGTRIGKIPGGIAGTFIGGVLGAAVGAGAGVAECSHSTACGSKGEDKKEGEPESKQEPQKPEEPTKAPNDTKPEPQPTTHPSPVDKPKPESTPDKGATPHPEKTPPEAGEKGKDQKDDDDKKEEDDKKKKDEDAKNSISQDPLNRDKFRIPVETKGKIEIHPPGHLNPIESTPMPPGMKLLKGKRK